MLATKLTTCLCHIMVNFKTSQACSAFLSPFSQTGCPVERICPPSAPTVRHQTTNYKHREFVVISDCIFKGFILSFSSYTKLSLCDLAAVSLAPLWRRSMSEVRMERTSRRISGSSISVKDKRGSKKDEGNAVSRLVLS